MILSYLSLLSGLAKSENGGHRLLKGTRVQWLQCLIRTLSSPMVPIILVPSFNKAPKNNHSLKNHDFLS